MDFLPLPAHSQDAADSRQRWVALGAAARAGRQWIWGGPAGSGTTNNEGAMTTTSTNYITVRRAAELAGVSHWAIRKWIKRGRLRVKQPGGNRGDLLIDKSSINNWHATQVQTLITEPMLKARNYFKLKIIIIFKC